MNDELKPKRKYKSRKPADVQQAIIAKAMLGDTMSQIGRDLDVQRQTVAKILSQTDIAQHVEEARSDMVLSGDIRKSVTVLRQRLDKGSESAATTILRGFNVLRTNSDTTINVLNNGAMHWTQIVEAKRADNERATTISSGPTLP